MCRLTLLVCVTLTLMAQDRPRPAATLGLIDRARGLPPEFAADILLRLAGSGSIAETNWKHELIEEAFTSGAHAQLPYRQTAPGLSTDSRANLEVSHNDLEALTLQTRAVNAMLAIDPPKALAMYRQIVLPQVPRTKCENPVTPDLAAYYETASRVFGYAFTPEQRRREDDIHFLKQRISQMQSPAHVVPVLKMMFAVGLTPVQRQELTADFAVTLDPLSGDDRIYAATESSLVPAALPEWHETPLLVPALRSYIVRQIGGPRCSDSLKFKGALPPSAATLNRLAGFLTASAQPYRAITPEEARPLRDDGTYTDRLPWRSARSRQALEALKWLTHGNRDLPDAERFWTLEERSTAEWNARYLDTVKLIEGWKEDEEESPEDYLFMVAHTYSVLAGLVPPGPARNNAMGNYRAFLETHYAVTENRNLWFTLVNLMLKTAACSKDPKERVWILEELSRSSNPVIALYATVGKLLGPG